MPKSFLPNLAITMGDPAGIGPEIILQALSNPQFQTKCNITVIGSLEVLKNTYQRLHKQLNLANPEDILVWDVPLESKIEPGKGTAAPGSGARAGRATGARAGAAGGQTPGREPPPERTGADPPGDARPPA